MEFVSFVKYDEIKNIKSDKKFIFFQFLSNLKEFININTDIYVQYQLNSKGIKILPDYDSLVSLFIKSPIYIGELAIFAKNQKKIFSDTKKLIEKIYKYPKTIIYNDIMENNNKNLYYVNLIAGFPVVSFLIVSE
jgi:hypothetical protein